MPDIVVDDSTTVADLCRGVASFVAEREWEQFHSPEHLSQAIAVEAAELMEHFLWLTREQAVSMVEEDVKRAAVVDELADVLIYAFSLANALEIDVSTAVLEKLERNERRFPVDEWRGRARSDEFI